MESPLCWGSHVLARLEIPKDETKSNHFQTSGSSPLGSREGSLYISKGFMSLKLKFSNVRLVIGTRFVCLIVYVLVVGNQE